MSKRHADVVILGIGTAGMAAWSALRRHGADVVAVDAGPLGTTCARVGCMPSKLLIAAAEAARAVARAGTFGVQVQGLRVDGAAVLQRLRQERDRFVGHVLAEVDRWPEASRLQGRARFVDAHTVRLDGGAHHGLELRAGRFIIATGSRPTVPAGWRQALGARLAVNDDVFDWPTLPSSVAVAGTGVIGLELAQALHALGVRVRLYGREGRVGPLTDPELQSLARELIGADLPLSLGAGELQPVLDDGQVLLAPRAAPAERFELLLAATGRRPNVDDLGLAHTGLALDERGVPRFDPLTGRCGDSTIFIAGDADAERPLLHEAADAGRRAGDNAGRFPELRAQPRRTAMAVVFSHPQMAMVGRRHADLARDPAAFATGRVSWVDQGRSRVLALNQGALHLYGARGDGRLLGAEMIGPAAEHLAHLLAWAIARGDTVADLLAYPFYHPVVEEGLRTALRDLRRNLSLGPAPVQRCLDCGPGA